MTTRLADFRDSTSLSQIPIKSIVQDSFRQKLTWLCPCFIRSHWIIEENLERDPGSTVFLRNSATREYLFFLRPSPRTLRSVSNTETRKQTMERVSSTTLKISYQDKDIML